MISRLTIVLATAVAVVAGFMAAPAVAEDGEPTMRTTGAWLVGQGAAVEVGYEITCPPNPMTGEYSALNLTVHQGEELVGTAYLVFDCGPQPRDVVALVSLRRPVSGPVTVSTEMTNCLYFPSEGVPGCSEPSETRTFRLVPRAFEEETWHEEGAEIELTGARLTPQGTVAVTATLICATDLWGYASAVAHQVRRGALVSGRAVPANGATDGYVDCAAGTPVPLTFEIAPSPGSGRFGSGPIVLETSFVQCEEACAQTFDSGVSRIRLSRD